MKAPLILVAEDNPITRRMVRFALESERYEVMEAGDGQGALSLAAERRPDLVIQDYVLPDMDGLELLRRLRALPQGAQMPVLIVTGMSSLIEELRVQAAGPTTVLPKPLEPSRMLEIVRSYLAPGPRTRGRGARVLLVDDEVLGRKLAALRLRDAGFEVETAESGEEALRKAWASPPDAVLSDVLMPGLDGFALCRALRTGERTSAVPVVLLSSAFVDEPDRRLAEAVGAAGLLLRSPDFAEAIATLEQSIVRGGTPAAAAASQEVDALHAQRVHAQLEKQVARNSALLRQGAIQAAALSVVRGFAQALAHPRDLAGMLGDVLVHCLDAAGLSTGLLYLPGPDGRLRLHAAAGLTNEARADAAAFFGQPDLLERTLDSGQPLALDLAAPGLGPHLRELARRLGHASAAVIPFLAAGQRLGALVLASDSHDLSEPGWQGFARALGAQFAQTIAVGHSMARGAASEVRYQTLLEHASDAILLLDGSGLVLEANRQAQSVLARTSGEIVGQPYARFVASEGRGVRHDGTRHFEGARIARPDGSVVVVDVSRTFVALERERLELVILHDVTERHRAETELRRLQERLDHVVTSSPAVLYVLKVEGPELVPSWSSANIERLTGHTAEATLARGWWESHVHPDDLERVRARRPELLEEGETTRDYRLRNTSGAYRWIRDEQRLLQGAEGSPVEVVGAWWDIEELKQAELRLEESEEQYRLLFESNPHPMWVHDAESLRFLAVNEAAVQSYGFAHHEFLGMTLEDLRPPDERRALRRLLADATRAGASSLWKHWNKAGEVRHVEVVCRPIRFQGRVATLVLANDVTEKAMLEAQLRQAQKMEAVGRLAGGVAHDFNNLLGVITGYTDLLLRDLGALHPAARRAEQVRRAAGRAADLTRQLLAFSRKQVLEPRVLDLNDVVADIEGMLRRLIGDDVQLLTARGADLGHVRADPGEIGQVIMNLAVNARDAMPRGGSLVLQTSNVDLGADDLRTQPDVRPGPYVLLAVRDSGEGIEPAALPRIFEPFFTTKAPGRGTGLGLSTVFGIVKQSGGHIGVDTARGQGTTFRIYLPRVLEEAAEPAPLEAEPAPARAHETVLLVEDAEGLREMIREVLEDAGYRVVPAARPEEALEAAARQPRLDLVLTDVVMPGLDGPGMVERLRLLHPGLPAVFMSGYTGRSGGGEDEALAAKGWFIQKPFTILALLRKLREALSGSA